MAPVHRRSKEGEGSGGAAATTGCRGGDTGLFGGTGLFGLPNILSAAAPTLA